MSSKIMIIGVVLLVLTGFVAASFVNREQVQHVQPTLQQTLVGAVTEDRAVSIARMVAPSWGEQNPRVTNVRKQLRRDFMQQVKAQGEDVLLAGKGDLWVVEMSGKFTPNRAPRGIIVHCDSMFVVIEIDSGDVISVGCR